MRSRMRFFKSENRTLGFDPLEMKDPACSRQRQEEHASGEEELENGLSRSVQRLESQHPSTPEIHFFVDLLSDELDLILNGSA